MINLLKQSESDFTIIKDGSIKQYISSPILQLINQQPFHLLNPKQFDSNHILDGTHLYKDLQYIKEVTQIYSNDIYQVMFKDSKFHLYINWSLQYSIEFQFDIVDHICHSKYIIASLHSSIFFYERELIHIIQLEQEIHKVFPLNQFGCIGVSLIQEDKILIFDESVNKPILTFDGDLYDNVSFKIDNNQIITAVQIEDGILFIQVENICHSTQFKTNKLNLQIKQIHKFNDYLLILSNHILYLINMIDFNINNSVEQQLQRIYTTSQFKTILSNEKYIFNYDNQQIEIFELLDSYQFRFKSNELNVKSIEISGNHIIVILNKQIQIYDLQFKLINEFLYERQLQNITYCPHYQGIMLWETQTKFQDMQPANNYVLQTQEFQTTNIHLVDIQNNSYVPNNQEICQQSYLIQQCGFILKYLAKQITNIQENYFVIQTNSSIKVIAIYNKPNLLENLFEFSILNQQLILFKNSLPLEDLERIPFLRTSKPEQNIDFSYFWSTNGIIQSSYAIKWAIINIKLRSATLINLEFPLDIHLNKVLHIDKDFIYLLSNNEELYLCTQQKLKLIYVCDQGISGAIVLGNDTIVLKSNMQLLVTELHDVNKIKFIN